MPAALTVTQDPTLFAVTCGLLGLLVGSFLNVVIHRLPKMMDRDWRLHCAELRGEEAAEHEHLSLATPRSRCPACGHGITAMENIPLLSWLFLHGRCSACQQPISPRYPLVEAISGLLSAFTAFHFGFGWPAAGAMLLVWCLIALTFIDFDTLLLPDAITLPLLWAGLLFNLLGTFADLQSAVIGAASGYLSLWSVYWAFKLTTGKEGMGYGDFKLLAALGAWLGWQMLPLTILLSSLLGAVVGLTLIVVAKRGRSVPIPFGPYLAAAGMLALFWGKPLTRAYIGLL
ncbi:Type 4 prepilin-like proteins leader peptide-processing enzyme (Includes: Leader peptidase; N-methyltransferase) [Candidatus Accumulibacter aalborgensis]|uniref:Prepilin leader peptidase/N-methyltransferase n=1 Tax=Candidatus Accumulibacter aalborgensis TaxID=1860102 RepID=A0A1A8XPH1_9PROT|nr:A24 family peptidase [Candidatus Accumulibacter aalborgensis]SBT07074.1 Type 4 prepilin-like proteins leader peptide-processing enzyme (Includes: Leader peptidase; N-methyltransferase) [Candidatus Accumulibacter aalborgensis]